MLDFKYDGGGIGKGGMATLTVDGQKAAAGRIERTLPFRISLDETLDIGEDTGTPVSEDYAAKMPFKFTGTLKKVVIDIGPEKLSSEDKRKVEEARELAEERHRINFPIMPANYGFWAWCRPSSLQSIRCLPSCCDTLLDRR